MGMPNEDQCIHGYLYACGDPVANDEGTYECRRQKVTDKQVIERIEAGVEELLEIAIKEKVNATRGNKVNGIIHWIGQESAFEKVKKIITEAKEMKVASNRCGVWMNEQEKKELRKKMKKNKSSTPPLRNCIDSTPQPVGPVGAEPGDCVVNGNGTVLEAEAEENPLRSLGACMAFSPCDWSTHHRTAWMYGIIHGWDGEALEEMIQKHGWDEETVERLKRLHAKYLQHKKLLDAL